MNDKKDIKYSEKPPTSHYPLKFEKAVKKLFKMKKLNASLHIDNSHSKNVKK